MGKVYLDGYLAVPADCIDAVMAALPRHIELTQAEPGCIAFEVTQNPNMPERFDVSEIFADQAAFDRHQQRAQASAWAEVTLGMPRHFTIRTEDGG